MKRVVLVLSCLTLAGCGGDQKNADLSGLLADPPTTTQAVNPAEHNAQVVQQAKSEEGSIAAIHAKLARRLAFRTEAGVPDSFDVASGTCSVQDITQVDAYSGSAGPNDLLSPDGKWEVNVNVFVNLDTNRTTPLSDCLTAVRVALKW